MNDDLARCVSLTVGFRSMGASYTSFGRKRLGLFGPPLTAAFFAHFLFSSKSLQKFTRGRRPLTRTSRHSYGPVQSTPEDGHYLRALTSPIALETNGFEICISSVRLSDAIFARLVVIIVGRR